MTNLNDFRVTKTKRKLQRAFLGVLKMKPFDKITVKDVVSKAHVGRSTFYNNYADKYQLAQELINAFLKKYQELINQRVVTFNNGNTEQWDAQRKDLYQTMIHEIFTLHRINSEEVNFERAFKAVLKQSFWDNLTQVDLQINDPEGTARVLAGIFMNYIHDNIENETAPTFGAMDSQMLDLAKVIQYINIR